MEIYVRIQRIEKETPQDCDNKTMIKIAKKNIKRKNKMFKQLTTALSFQLVFSSEMLQIWRQKEKKRQGRRNVAKNKRNNEDRKD